MKLEQQDQQSRPGLLWPTECQSRAYVEWTETKKTISDYGTIRMYTQLTVN